MTILLSLMLFSDNVLLGLYLFIYLSCCELERYTQDFSLPEMTPPSFFFWWGCYQWSKVPLESRGGECWCKRKRCDCLGDVAAIIEVEKILLG